MAEAENPKKRFQPKQFTKDVVYDSVVQVTSDALRVAAVALLILMVALIALGWSVPAWTLIFAMIVAVGLVYLTKRVVGREANELRPKLKVAEDKLDRHDSYGTNICSIMDNFQRVLAGDIEELSTGDFIERGILTAGRDVMQENGHAPDLRMAVMLAKDGNFKMAWASGHSIKGQNKYKQPIEKTISRIAYEKKGMQLWKDVTTEERTFEANPHATRTFKSMVSMPLLVGDHAVGVFNVVTERVDAFDMADVNYLTSLGAVIQTAVGVAVKDAKRIDPEESRVAKKVPAAESPRPQKKQRILRRIPPKPAPESGVGSGQSPDETEASDD